MTPEQRARQEIDRLLTAAGWHVCGMADANIHAARGVAIREFPLSDGHGYADYLFYVGGKAAGVIEAKKAGVPLIGVEHQSGRYVQGLPAALPAWRRPLPFAYESTGIETRFTSGLDTEPRSRPVFAFHQPATLADWLAGLPAHGTVPVSGGVHDAPPTDSFRRRLRAMPELITEWGDQKLWPAQIQAIRNLEKSLAADKPRALIQMATGSGKTFTAISAIYRLIKFAGARRVLFLVDRGNLGRQAKKEFDQYVSPVNNYKFGEEYIATDEAHRSIYNLWRQVLEYFDAYLIGLTATPNKQTFGFYNQNLVMEYGHPQAVADGVNVNHDVYRIKTEVTEAGATVEAGYWPRATYSSTHPKSWTAACGRISRPMSREA